MENKNEFKSLIERILVLLGNPIFKMILLLSVFISLLMIFFMRNSEVYQTIIFLGSGIGLPIVIGFYFFSKKRFMNALDLQILLLESLTKEITVLIASSEDKNKKAKEFAISITYLINLKRKNIKIKVFLWISIFTFILLNFYFSDSELLIFSIILASTLFLISIKELIVEFRIKKGWFGTNKVEAKALIDFLIANSDEIDFTDNDGKLKRSLFPDSTLEQQTKTVTPSEVTV